MGEAGKEKQVQDNKFANMLLPDAKLFRHERRKPHPAQVWRTNPTESADRLRVISTSSILV